MLQSSSLFIGQIQRGEPCSFAVQKMPEYHRPPNCRCKTLAGHEWSFSFISFKLISFLGKNKHFFFGSTKWRALRPMTLTRIALQRECSMYIETEHELVTNVLFVCKLTLHFAGLTFISKVSKLYKGLMKLIIYGKISKYDKISSLNN